MAILHGREYLTLFYIVLGSAQPTLTATTTLVTTAATTKLATNILLTMATTTTG